MVKLGLGTVLALTSLTVFAQGYPGQVGAPKRPARESAPAANASRSIVQSNAVELVNNGSFESNGGEHSSSFSGWTVVDGGSGSWFVQTGTTPAGNQVCTFDVPAPPAGTFSAMTSQSEPGSHILYQDVTIPSGVTQAELSFDLFVVTSALDYVTPDSLDHLGDPNQQLRVDIVDPLADPDALGDSVLLNVFRTEVGSDLEFGYTTVTADLTQFEGQTVRLRFAEVDNQTCFSAGVDNVSIAVTARQEVPSLSQWMLGLMAGLLALAGIVMARR